jgi:predicted protein tyrosine phosphatase
MHLNDLVNNKNNKVFVHCTSGMSRSPALIITYMCLFIKSYNWGKPSEIDLQLKKLNSKIKPNLHIVKEVINMNKNF